MGDKPVYFHLWGCCRFLATCKEPGPWQDIYICGWLEHAEIVTVRNDDPADTFSLRQQTLDLPGAEVRFPAAHWGLRLARSKGLL